MTVHGARLVVVGNDSGTNVGASLLRSAQALGLDVRLHDSRRAYDASKLVARFNWWLRGRRPTRLQSFSDELVAMCRTFRPDWLIATGLAPITGPALAELRGLGVKTLNYSTDDPWNPAFKSRWFLDALPRYHHVFSTRTSNLDDFVAAGCPRVDYLPFAADPELFFPEDVAASDLEAYRADVCFAGGSEPARVEFLSALIRAGLKVAVYGDHWNRHVETRHVWRGYATPAVLRKATRASAISLCFVRRANRDGHTMRTFEVPAMGGCMLAEDTAEHRALFGEDDEAVAYFGSVDDCVSVARSLVTDRARQTRLAERALAVIAGGAHSYGHRLQAMLQAGGAS